MHLKPMIFKQVINTHTHKTPATCDFTDGMLELVMGREVLATQLSGPVQKGPYESTVGQGH